MLDKVRQQEQAKANAQLSALRAEQERQAKTQAETLAQLEKLTKLLTERAAAPAPAPAPAPAAVVPSASAGGLKVPAGGKDRRRSAMMEHVPELEKDDEDEDRPKLASASEKKSLSEQIAAAKDLYHARKWDEAFPALLSLIKAGKLVPRLCSMLATCYHYGWGTAINDQARAECVAPRPVLSLHPFIGTGAPLWYGRVHGRHLRPMCACSPLRRGWTIEHVWLTADAIAHRLPLALPCLGHRRPGEGHGTRQRAVRQGCAQPAGPGDQPGQHARSGRGADVPRYGMAVAARAVHCPHSRDAVAGVCYHQGTGVTRDPAVRGPQWRGVRHVSEL
jgi:hypothetical protein